MIKSASIRSIKWEFGYWGKTINNWYKHGLPKKNPAPIPSEFTTPGAFLYMTAWNWKNKYRYKNGVEGFPNGIGIWGGTLYWPSHLSSDTISYEVRGHELLRIIPHRHNCTLCN